MTAQEQRRRAQLFAQKWQQKAGYEKGQTQAFWLELLHEVLDMPEASEHIQFEVPVQFSAKDDSGSTHTSVKLHKYVTKSIGLSEWQKEDQR